MPMAPRPGARAKTNNKGQSKGMSHGPSSSGTAAGAAAASARKAAARTATGNIKVSVIQYPHVDWEEVEDVVEHIVDIAGTISHSQVGTTGNVVSSINCPKAYAHAVLDAHLASEDGMCYIRVYKVGRELFEDKQRRLAQAAAELEAQMQAIEYGTQETLLDPSFGVAP